MTGGSAEERGGGVGRAFAPPPPSPSSPSSLHSPRLEPDALTAWIAGRQRAFRDFERSFLQPLTADEQQRLPDLTPPSPPPPPPFLFLPPPPPPTRQQQQPSAPRLPSRPLAFDAGRDNAEQLYLPPIGDATPDHDFDYLTSDAAAKMLSRTNASGRSGDLDRDLSPKARVTYDEGRFQVEFDVRDYRPEELSIKTEGDVLIVLAKHETKTEGGGSFVSRQFEQRFTLPSGVKPESITSSLAKDGTLTVTAPRERQANEMQAIKAPSTSASPNSKVYAHGGANDNGGGGAGDGDQGLPHPRVKYDEDKFQIALDCQNYRPEELDVKVEGNTIIITAKQETKEAGGTRTRVFEQKFTLPSGVRGEKVSSSFSKDGVLTITAPRASNLALTSQPHHDSPLGRKSSSDVAGDGGGHSASSATSGVERHMDRVLSPSSWEDNFQRRESGTIGTGVTSLGGSAQPVKQHHSLFDRDVFAHSGGVGGVGGVGGTSSDGLSKVEVDDANYRILVDVRDFSPEELIIKTVGNTVHFEAKHEEKTPDGHSYTSTNISQSFTLPRGVDPESVTSSLSKEGTLTIAAPLPQALKLQSNERLVPIKHR